MKAKLPLLVMYRSGESWYVKDDIPVAIFLKPDEHAIYAFDLPKLQWGTARSKCMDMTVENLYWTMPTQSQLQLLLSMEEVVNRTSILIHVPGIRPSRYWSMGEAGEHLRYCIDFGTNEEFPFPEYKYSYTRPFLRM